MSQYNKIFASALTISSMFACTITVPLKPLKEDVTFFCRLFSNNNAKSQHKTTILILAQRLSLFDPPAVPFDTAKISTRPPNDSDNSASLSFRHTLLRRAVLM